MCSSDLGQYISSQFGGCFPSRQGISGSTGTATLGGGGGISTNGGATGGQGGDRGQNGANGTGSLSLSAIGGSAGKAIGGGSGNVLTNLVGGQSFGLVD